MRGVARDAVGGGTAATSRAASGAEATASGGATGNAGSATTASGALTSDADFRDFRLPKALERRRMGAQE